VRRPTSYWGMETNQSVGRRSGTMRKVATERQHHRYFFLNGAGKERGINDKSFRYGYSGNIPLGKHQSNHDL
jgi:hypothetical protein